MASQLKPATIRAIGRLFERLDYHALGRIYCYAGGDAFWRNRRGPCRRLGIRLAEVLRRHLRPGGRSLYVGAGVAEVPILVMETLELEREVAAYTLREEEAAVLNAALAGLPLQVMAGQARSATGSFDHLWIVSVLNDPERFPELSALSYGLANPVTFDPVIFRRERQAVTRLVRACLRKLTRPGLVTTSVEEIPWITDWCERRRMACAVGPEDYPTAIVRDRACLIRIGEAEPAGSRRGSR